MINTAFQNEEEQILLSQLNKDSEVPAAAAEHSRNQVMDASLKKKKKKKAPCTCTSTAGTGTGAPHQSR